MVMHARKLPRISDGFSEKHQTHSHGYENSKYSTSKYRYGNHEKSRDSPSTNSLRSSSPDSHSQSPRYHKNNYYKVREKERERERENRDRERDREREYKDYRERDNSRSPKDRRRDIRERDHRESRPGLHDRINSIHKKEEKERLMRVGDWSEHVSSSGKKYYYNCRTEVSQWEKPPEWIEWERTHRGSGIPPVPVNITLKDSNVHRGHDKINRPDKHSTLGDSYRDCRDGRETDRERVERERREYRMDDHLDRRDVRKYTQEIGTTDMEISSGDSTPTSETHHGRSLAENVGLDGLSNLGIMSSSHPLSGGPNHGRSGKLIGGPLGSSLPGIVPCSLPTTSSTDYHTGNSVSLMSNSVLPAIPQPLNSHPRLMALSCGPSGESKLEDGLVSKMSKLPLEPLIINSNICSAGPPTPTHSENQDGIDIRKIASPSSSLNSLQSLTQNSTSVPCLTPSLANYYKEPLIAHVQGWPADAIEKQCQRSFEEAHTMSSLIMTKVSADLKMARSLVRLAEIQATLHEQRILFLRAQKRELEEVKTQNCFMNDT